MIRFVYGLKSPDSKRKYPRMFKLFLDYLGLDGELRDDAIEFLKRAKESPEWVEDRLVSFINSQSERADRGEIRAATIQNYYKAIKRFCGMNKVRLDWTMISCGIPSGCNAADDRAPNLDEIQRLLKDHDPRIKSIVYVMASSGIRLGAWDHLRWKHIEPITGNGEVVAAKMLVYAGQNQGKKKQYRSYISPEAYNALKEWMESRKRHGEEVTGESWVMRDLWQTSNVKRGANCGLATNPRRFKSSGIKGLINRALWRQGIRLAPAKRHEFKALHGFRKFYMSNAEQAGMKSINIKILMGHSIRIEDSYYRPEERDISRDYKIAVPNLTIVDRLTNTQSRDSAEKRRLSIAHKENRNSCKDYKSFNDLTDDSILNKTNEAIEFLKDKNFGNKIQKNLWPKRYRDRYHIDNFLQEETIKLLQRQ